MNDQASATPVEPVGPHGHELNEFSVRFVLSILGGIALAVVVALCLMYAAFHVLASHGEAPMQVPASLQVREQPVEPALNPSKRQQLRELRAAESTMLGEHKWIDEEAGLARIPIDRAIDILAQEKLPVRPQPTRLREEGADR